MFKKTNKRKLMKSLKDKWDNDKIKAKVADMAGSRQKDDQITYLSSELEGMSDRKVEKKLKSMGFSDREREAIVKENDELKRVYGIKDDGERELSKREKRKMQKKADMHKKFMVRRSRKATIEDRKSARKNRVAAAYDKGKGSAKEYGYANVEEKGHHEATALGASSGGAASVAKGGGDSSVVGQRKASSLTGGEKRSAAKGGRPIGL